MAVTPSRPIPPPRDFAWPDFSNPTDLQPLAPRPVLPIHLAQASAPASDATKVDPAPLAPRRVTISGLGQFNNVAANAASRFGDNQGFKQAGGGAASRVDRGFIRVDAAPTSDGARIHVQSFHSQTNDPLTLMLMIEILDQQKQELRTHTLAVLADREVLNPTGYKGEGYFDISYDEVNRYLAARNPHAKLIPGQTRLAVVASWANGHQAGGFGRLGTFETPVAQITAAGAVGGAASATAGANLPLDLEIVYPPELLSAVPSLKKDGGITSRLESEFKGTSSAEEMAEARRRVYAMVEKIKAGDSSEIEALLGEGWTIEPVERYWLKDDGKADQVGSPGAGVFKGYRVDANSMPIQDPMFDIYMDTGTLGMTAFEGATRLRWNKAGVQLNVKPGAGRRDPKTGIVQRIEYGYDLVGSATTADVQAALSTISQSRWSSTIFNQATREVAKLDAGLFLPNALVPWLKIEQDRHKFLVRNTKTGVAIEFSLDNVKTRSLREDHSNDDGSPRTAEFSVLEAELDHLNINTAPKANYALGGISEVGHHTNQDAQDEWLRRASSNLTTVIDPRLHYLEDLENEDFRRTPSYQQFEGVLAKLIPQLFPNGLQRGHQKSAYAAQAMGLAFLSDESLLRGVEAAVVRSGYGWNPSLKKSFEASVKDPTRRSRLQQLLAQPHQLPVADLLGLGDTRALALESSTFRERVARRLRETGFDMNPEIIALVDKVVSAKVGMQAIEQAFIYDANGEDLLSQLAGLLRIRAPVAKINPDFLVGNSLMGRRIREGLERAGLDTPSIGKVEAFLIATAAGTQELPELRARLLRLIALQQGRVGEARSALLEVAKFAGGATLPELRVKSEWLISRFTAAATQRQVIVDAPIKDFLTAAAATLSVNETMRFEAQLSQDMGALDDLAARLGVPRPALRFDMAAVATVLQSACRNGGIVYSSELAAFAEQALSAGVPVNRLQEAFSIGSGNLRRDCEAVGLYLVGVSFPRLQWDFAALETSLRATVSSASPTLTATDLKAFAQKLLDAGMTPLTIRNYVAYALSYGVSTARDSYGYAAEVALDILLPWPLAPDGLIAHWKTRQGWSPEVESYVRQAWPLLMQDPTLVPHSLASRSVRDLLSLVEKSSKLKRPAGL